MIILCAFSCSSIHNKCTLMYNIHMSIMTIRKGGIGRKSGKKSGYKQQIATKTSSTLSKLATVRAQK